ncbi:hypothetical protein [Bacillus thuringiensis]|uniref:hypothetical protein n=1 Tax=Bacillus thuringiensis TaxID=1428 RepID=UPI003D9FD95E
MEAKMKARSNYFRVKDEYAAERLVILVKYQMMNARLEEKEKDGECYFSFIKEGRLDDYASEPYTPNYDIAVQLQEVLHSEEILVVQEICFCDDLEVNAAVCIIRKHDISYMTLSKVVAEFLHNIDSYFIVDMNDPSKSLS